VYYFERVSDNKRSEMSGMFLSTDEMQYEMQYCKACVMPCGRFSVDHSFPLRGKAQHQLPATSNHNIRPYHT
jgi:hypothetical protein